MPSKKKRAAPRSAETIEQATTVTGIEIFISWSGQGSRIVAEKLSKWLQKVIQSVTTFCSTKDIEKGARWREEIEAHLATAKFGIVCVTPENVGAPWLHFEAGALAKTMPEVDGEPAVCTYLIGLGHSDVKGPLSEFQGTIASRDDTRALLKSINGAVARVTGRELPKESLDELFEVLWPELETEIERAKKATAVKPPARSADDMVREVLEIVRGLAHARTDELRMRAEGEMMRRAEAEMRLAAAESVLRRAAVPNEEAQAERVKSASAKAPNEALFQKLHELLRSPTDRSRLTDRMKP